MRHAPGMSSKIVLCCLVGLASAFIGGCAATRSVRPLGEGHLAAGASLGGPLFNNLAVPVVAPLASVFGRFGLTHRTDVDMGILLPVGRVTGVDLGISHLLVHPKGAGPYLMVGGRAAVMGNARSWVQKSDINTNSALGFSAEWFEEVYVNASWNVTQASYAFVGADVFAQVQRNTWRPSIMGGFVWRNRRGLSLQAQVNWIALHRATDQLSLRYVSIADLGSVGLQLGLAYDFGRVTARAAGG